MFLPVSVYLPFCQLPLAPTVYFELSLGEEEEESEVEVPSQVSFGSTLITITQRFFLFFLLSSQPGFFLSFFQTGSKSLV